MSRDGKRHMRWTASYPRTEPPFSKSCVWNEVITERDSVITILRWVWAEHGIARGEECPYDFEEAL